MHIILCARYLGGAENYFPHALKILIDNFFPIYKIWFSDGYLLLSFSVNVSYLMLKIYLFCQCEDMVGKY